ncbi:hypothetical protein HY570_01105 [Candidatus Micrarchaeota archaeon]|nr:hypothetical protein [Candidatus Micrarchaeota archaeon]
MAATATKQSPEQKYTPDQKRALEEIHTALFAISKRYEKGEFGPETFKTLRLILSKLADAVRKGKLNKPGINLADHVNQSIAQINRMADLCTTISSSLREQSRKKDKSTLSSNLSNYKDMVGKIGRFDPAAKIGSSSASELLERLVTLADIVTGKSTIVGPAPQVTTEHLAKVQTRPQYSITFSVRVNSTDGPAAVTRNATQSFTIQSQFTNEDRKTLASLIEGLLKTKYNSNVASVTINQSNEVTILLNETNPNQDIDKIVTKVIDDSVKLLSKVHEENPPA